jgi:hypothetical protein
MTCGLIAAHVAVGVLGYVLGRYHPWTRDKRGIE